MYKAPTQPFTQRGIDQDLVGVFASVHRLTANDVEITYPCESKPEFRPDAESFYTSCENDLYQVKVSNDWYVACENLVSKRIELLELSQFREPFDGDKREPEYILTKIPEADALRLAAVQIEKEAHDQEIWRDLAGWAVHDCEVGIDSLTLPGTLYLQLSKRMQNANAEIFINLGENKTLRLFSTWLPQEVNKDSKELLAKSAEFLKLVQQGHVLILSNSYASKLLEMHASEVEYERLGLNNSKPRRLETLIYKRGGSLTIMD